MPHSSHMLERPRLSELSVEDLLKRAAEYRFMATTARTANTQRSLQRLAEAFETLATSRQELPHITSRLEARDCHISRRLWQKPKKPADQ
jgi:hypothetical protein